MDLNEQLISLGGCETMKPNLPALKVIPEGQMKSWMEDLRRLIRESRSEREYSPVNDLLPPTEGQVRAKEEWKLLWSSACKNWLAQRYRWGSLRESNALLLLRIELEREWGLKRVKEEMRRKRLVEEEEVKAREDRKVGEGVRRWRKFAEEMWRGKGRRLAGGDWKGGE